VAIVVGVDGSEESLQALRWSIEEARLRHATVRVVNVWQYPTVTSWIDPYLAGAAYEVPQINAEELRTRAEAQLAGVVEQVDTAGVEVTQETIEGHPAEGLLYAAKDAELLVVGSRGLGGFKALLLGSVGQQCAHHAPCPIVIVRDASA